MHSALADGITGLMFAVYGAIALVLIALAIIFISEAIVLWKLAWGSPGRSLLASFVMNMASSIAGFVLFVPGSGIVRALFGIVGSVLIAWLTSVIVEFGVLSAMKRGASQRNLLASAVANTISYLLTVAALAVRFGGEFVGFLFAWLPYRFRMLFGGGSINSGEVLPVALFALMGVGGLVLLLVAIAQSARGAKRS